MLFRSFIESGLISMVGTTKPNHRIEVGMVGYEGMTGYGVVLGNNRSRATRRRLRMGAGGSTNGSPAGC